MKYVCSMCGTQLAIDKDIDEDAVVQAVIYYHEKDHCSHGFDPPHDHISRGGPFSVWGDASTPAEYAEQPPDVT